MFDAEIDARRHAMENYEDVAFVTFGESVADIGKSEPRLKIKPS